MLRDRPQRLVTLGYLGHMWELYALVIADSAQFSAALSEVAARRYVGTALTAQVAMGFTLTILTVQGLPIVESWLGWEGVMPLLALGPAAGIIAMLRVQSELGRRREWMDSNK